MIIRERRSRIDTRSEAEKQLIGERRSRIDRRANAESAPTTPPNGQLAIFARRLRRTMRDQQGRGYFGVTSAEHEFALFPDVVRVVEWIERLSAPENQARP